MAIEVKQFEFTANTSTGTQQIASGLGFTPKAYIIFGTLNSSNATYQSHYGSLFGASDGTTDWCQSYHSQDAQGTSVAGTAYSDKVIVIPSTTTPTTTTNGIAAHSSFGSGTITINWTEAPDTAFKFYGMAFGGSGLSVKALRTTVGTSSVGNKAYTGVGFQGKAGLFYVNNIVTSPPNSTSGGNASIGFAVSSSKRFLVSLTSEHSRTTMDTWGYVNSTKCAGTLSPSTGAITSEADFVSWDSDGFTLNWTDPPSLGSVNFFALIFGGDGTWDCGKVVKRTSTGTTDVSPTAETIKGIMLFSNNFQDSTSNTSHARISMGAASSTTDQGGCWSGDKDAADPSETAKRSEDSNILIMATEHATDTSSTTEAIADISAMSTTFTLNYTTCTTLAADIFWIAVGEVVAAEVVEDIIPRHFGNPNTGLVNNVPQLGNTGTIFGY